MAVAVDGCRVVRRQRDLQAPPPLGAPGEEGDGIEPRHRLRRHRREQSGDGGGTAQAGGDGHSVLAVGGLP